MAYGFEEGFEFGAPPLVSTGKGAFTSKTDTGGRMLFPGPRQLISDNYRIAPYRGGGLCRVDFSKSAADAYLQADAAFDVTGTSTMFFRMMCMCYSLDLSTDTDVFDIFRGISAGPATTYAAKVTWREPEGLVLSLQGQTASIPLDKWFCVEGEVKAGTGGHVKLYLESGSTLVYAPTTVAAITEFQLGVLGQAGTITQGSMCFDEVYAHTARLFQPQGPRDAMSLDGASLRMRKSGFAFVGTGEILSLQLTAEAGTDNKVYVYDSATPSFSEDDLVEVLTATTAGLTKINQRILRFQRGAWLQISGTDPLVVMQLGTIGEADFLGDYGGDMESESASATAE